MSDLQTLFTQAQADVKTLSERPDNQTLLQLYALYKQATDGDASGERPGMMDFINRAKFDAWEKLKGKSADEAMQEYVDVVKKLLAD
ncbi:acyl-CoA-binding protein [Chromobacterium paludis]|uniref:Acyl-CoA-binding protein n=1 Tax=Chromobacterium paludis TaxID=2605945 RepID=A0A5C1DIT4_9NEIS|nr:acyl-CoA-binding protein [Chromobacterium paludis]QEL55859.1 acyl-CoA-binding protein [Chromobacterium paludis]